MTDLDMDTNPDRRLTLISTSRAQDAGYLATADLQAITERLGVEWRLIGGIAVSLLTWVHGVTHLVPGRDTADADLAADHAVLADPHLVQALVDLGYEQVAGNRFERKLIHDESPVTLALDLLAPGHRSRLVSNVPVGEHLVVDEIPGSNAFMPPACVPRTGP